MDVTQQENVYRLSMGGSGSARPEYFSPNRTLDFAKSSNSLINARPQRITAIPQSINYKDTVGLFGAENIFIKIDLDILSAVSVFGTDDIPVNTYFPAFVDFDAVDEGLYYEQAVMDFQKDRFTINTYEPATISNTLESIPRPLVRIDLNNLKTGNKYIDAWFDTRLYTKDRVEHPYDVMYVNPSSFFYIGFHARNTKRLPYNVRMTVGSEFISEFDLPADQRRFLAS
tara:strand:+ start:550 stop:1233 length:684 start_codon:yes stop_codon:yes gene_type:complete